MTGRLIDVLSVVLLLVALLAFAGGIYSLGIAKDVQALYLLIIGALALRSATDLLRPAGGVR